MWPEWIECGGGSGELDRPAADSRTRARRRNMKAQTGLLIAAYGMAVSAVLYAMVGFLGYEPIQAVWAVSSILAATVAAGLVLAWHKVRKASGPRT